MARIHLSNGLPPGHTWLCYLHNRDIILLTLKFNCSVLVKIMTGFKNPLSQILLSLALILSIETRIKLDDCIEWLRTCPPACWTPHPVCTPCNKILTMLQWLKEFHTYVKATAQTRPGNVVDARLFQYNLNSPSFIKQRLQ